MIQRKVPFALVVLVGATLAGGASAATSTNKAPHHPRTNAGEAQSAEPTDSDGSEKDVSGAVDPAKPSADAEARHGTFKGGSVERFHEGCIFPKGTPEPQDGWTHGDYVSAWAAATGSEGVRSAAHSTCGKPMAAVEHTRGAEDHGDKKLHGKSGEDHGNSDFE